MSDILDSSAHAVVVSEVNRPVLAFLEELDPESKELRLHVFLVAGVTAMNVHTVQSVSEP